MSKIRGQGPARTFPWPWTHGPVVRAEVVALACALPAEHGVPLSRWSCPEIARELGIRCQVSASASSVRRWLAADALKPWQHRSWISIRSPPPSSLPTASGAPSRSTRWPCQEPVLRRHDVVQRLISHLDRRHPFGHGGQTTSVAQESCSAEAELSGARCSAPAGPILAAWRVRRNAAGAVGTILSSPSVRMAPGACCPFGCGPRTGSRRRRNRKFHTQCSPPESERNSDGGFGYQAG
jgi:hypothetical protein